jgi:HEAT repeat protein
MIAALGAIGPDAKEAVPALIAAVRDGYGGVDDLVGFEAVVALAKIDPENVASSQYVLAMLRDKNPDVRHRAAALLGLIGHHLQAFAPALTEAMKDENPGVRVEAVRSFMKLRPDASLGVPALAHALGDSEKNARFYAANGLADYGPAAKPALRALIDAVAKEKEPDARAREIRALRYIGPDAAEAVPMLTELLKDPNKEVQSQAEKAIKKIKPEAARAAPGPKSGPVPGKPGG